ncbi:rubredoxin [Novosphingobium lentum]|uniref:rubredoxin n=1 Tax=Novosphingobium lentum TaxID=145287 RepID=UPI00082D3ED1|nr:rubredoxin [Novosphingobium lentum]
MRRWICLSCGHVYDEAEGDPASGIAPGTPFAALPPDWECPFCGAAKDQFVAEDEA